MRISDDRFIRDPYDHRNPLYWIALSEGSPSAVKSNKIDEIRPYCGPDHATHDRNNNFKKN